MAAEEVQYSYEYWDCSCGIKEIRGDSENCSGCGRHRDADVKFYRRNGPPEIISDKTEIQRFQSGPDWVCLFCRELNSNLTKQCASCGHSRQSDPDYFSNQQSKEEREKRRETRQTNQAKAMAGMHIVSVGAISAGVCLLIGATGWWATSTNKVDYKVTSVHWQRSIPIERYQWTELEDWQNSVHGDGVKELSRHSEVRSYDHRQVSTRVEHYTDMEQYQSGTRDETSSRYESLGNGAGKTVTTHQTVPVYSTRGVDRTRIMPVYQDFPIYDTKVRYRAKTYQPLYTASAQGYKCPTWPQAKLEKGLDNKIDKEQFRQERYDVTLTKSNQHDQGPATQELNPNAEEFTHKYLLGTHIAYSVNNMGVVTGEAHQVAASN